MGLKHQTPQQNVVKRSNAVLPSKQTARPMGGEVPVQTPSMAAASADTGSLPSPPSQASCKAPPKTKWAHQTAPSWTRFGGVTSASTFRTTTKPVTSASKHPIATSAGPVFMPRLPRQAAEGSRQTTKKESAESSATSMTAVSPMQMGYCSDGTTSPISPLAVPSTSSTTATMTTVSPCNVLRVPRPAPLKRRYSKLVSCIH